MFTPSHDLEPTSGNDTINNTQFSQVYSRKKNLVPKPMQVQASEYNSGNKVTISSPSLPAEPISDINLPVAIRK